MGEKSMVCQQKKWWAQK